MYHFAPSPAPTSTPPAQYPHEMFKTHEFQDDMRSLSSGSSGYADCSASEQSTSSPNSAGVVTMATAATTTTHLDDLEQICPTVTTGELVNYPWSDALGIDINFS